MLPVMLATILAWTPTDESVAQLRLDYAALRAAEDDYRAQREANALSGEQAADYAAFIAGLQRRVFEDCVAVLESGPPYPGDLPCPQQAPAETRSADIAVQAELTPAEQVAALDARLKNNEMTRDEYRAALDRLVDEYEKMLRRLDIRCDY